eukprot:8124213-Pyramimonas_sp.AAC.1
MEDPVGGLHRRRVAHQSVFADSWVEHGPRSCHWCEVPSSSAMCNMKPVLRLWGTLCQFQTTE